MIKKLLKKHSYNIVLDEWLKERKNNIKESSYLKYYNIITNNIKPTLGNINFKKLSNKDLLLFFNSEDIIELSNSTKQ